MVDYTISELSSLAQASLSPGDMASYLACEVALWTMNPQFNTPLHKAWTLELTVAVCFSCGPVVFGALVMPQWLSDGWADGH
eukprot:220602-Ditylum_brightwellii.AAC.1